jgi:hypothetical protein
MPVVEGDEDDVVGKIPRLGVEVGEDGGVGGGGLDCGEDIRDVL